MAELPDVIIFLGTAGARFVVIHQFLPSGGAWLSLGGTQILLDPGPGCLVQAVRRKVDPSKLEAIILSHRHLDHCADINITIEAMTDGGMKKRGLVFTPADALDHDPVIFSYLRPCLKSIETLTAGGCYQLNDISFETPVRHKHPVETYAFVFRTPRHALSWITDTRYFDELASYYAAELLIINVVRLSPGAPIDHLSLPEGKRITEEMRPKAAILTHFGMTMWRAKPWELAKRLTEETGVSVVAARDGMRFNLEQLEK